MTFTTSLYSALPFFISYQAGWNLSLIITRKCIERMKHIIKVTSNLHIAIIVLQCNPCLVLKHLLLPCGDDPGKGTQPTGLRLAHFFLLKDT